jgi:hypothetical protein
MKTALFLTLLLAFTNAFAITNTRAKCAVQGQTDLTFIVVMSQTTSQTLFYVNGTLVSGRVAPGSNWPAEAGNIEILNANGTTHSVVVCEKGE